jgi:hypothetical protein
MWRTIYLSKLPRFEKKLRVALDWTLDLIFSKDLVKFISLRAPSISKMDEESLVANLENLPQVMAEEALGEMVS